MAAQPSTRRVRRAHQLSTVTALHIKLPVSAAQAHPTQTYARTAFIEKIKQHRTLCDLANNTSVYFMKQQLSCGEGSRGGRPNDYGHIMEIRCT
jgi:hypothetical protein